MATAYSRCGRCGGNMWAPGQMEHSHITETNMPLKLKYRLKPMGWSRAASPRTNSPKGKHLTVRPRRRAYGPF